MLWTAHCNGANIPEQMLSVTLLLLLCHKEERYQCVKSRIIVLTGLELIRKDNKILVLKAFP